MSDNDSRISYVISDYLTPELSAAAVKSITSRRPGSQLVVVDAARRKMGYSQALNYGIAQLGDQPDIVACLNSDVEMLESDAPIVALFDEIPELAIVGPRQLNSEGRIAHGGIVAHEDGADWDLDLRHRCWLWNETDAHELTHGVTFDVPTVPGSVMYFRRATLKALGGWPEWTRFYYEDTFLCFLARHRGHRVFYTGETSWLHCGEGSPVSARWRHERMEEAREQFIAECERAGIPLRVWPDDALVVGRDVVA